jgi:hypothetical protein
MPKVSEQKPPIPQVAPHVTQTGNSLFDAAVPLANLPRVGLKFLIFGQSGTGKTTLACTFPKPLLLIRPEEVEDGSMSVRDVSGVYASPYIRDPDQISEVCAGQKATRRFRTIVLDGLTNLQDLVVKKHLGLQDTPVQYTWGMAREPDWNRIGIMLKDFCRDLFRLADLGTNVVLVGGERDLGKPSGDRADPEVTVPRITVGLIPGCVDWIHRVNDFNVHTWKRKKIIQRPLDVGPDVEPVMETVETGETEFCLHMSNDHSPYATKFRAPRGIRLPHVMVDPSYEKLWALIAGETG